MNETQQHDHNVRIAEREACIKAICPRCRRGEAVRWWPAGGGFWAHHTDEGVNVGTCEASRIREARK